VEAVGQVEAQGEADHDHQEHVGVHGAILPR
jgi:hypothetical protein